MKETVVFASWNGRYSDSPRALSEELWRRGAPVEHVWVLGEGAGPVPDRVTTVAPGSAAHLTHLQHARYIVSNDALSTPFRKTRGTTYLQTWHGTPLKRIAFDLAPMDVEGREPFRAAELGRDVARWDVLISPNRYSTDVLRRAFRYEGEVLETGYPRNDLLLAPERDEIRARVRRELRIEEGACAVLYAPTWRDGDPFQLKLDLQRVTRTLGDGYVLLVRAHGLVAHTARLGSARNVRHVTAFQDIRELYLPADALITDYSSAMFDFALTRKPMLFFTYDLQWYRDHLRGFYFDFEAEAPGPLLVSSCEVIEALQDLDRVRADHADAYERFRQRFCHLDDGKATERVVDALFGAP